MIKNGKFTFLLMCSGQEWKSADLLLHYWHLVAKNFNFTLLLTCLVVKNGNFTLLLTFSGQEWQLDRSTPTSSKMADLTSPKMHHGIYIMGCIWQPFCILQKKVEISCYFWVIRVVNSQLALYWHVRCNPPQCPQHTQNIPKWQLEISTMRAHICQV